MAPAFGPGCDPGVPRPSLASGSLHGACFSLCLCLCLSLCVSPVNKYSLFIHLFFKYLIYLFERERERERSGARSIQCKKLNLRVKKWRAAPVAQRFGATCSLGCDPGDPGSSRTSGSLHGACFSLCVSASLCLS